MRRASCQRLHIYLGDGVLAHFPSLTPFYGRNSFYFILGVKSHVLLHFFSQKPRFTLREKNLPAQTSSPLKWNVAFDIFSETERGVWQTKPCRLKQNVAFGKQGQIDRDRHPSLGSRRPSRSVFKREDWQAVRFLLRVQLARYGVLVQRRPGKAYEWNRFRNSRRNRDISVAWA